MKYSVFSFRFIDSVFIGF